MEKHLESLGVRLEGGRAESAPEMSSIESITTEIEWEQNLNDENDTMKTVKFGSVVKFRAIPANNRGNKPGRLSRKHRSIGMDEPASPTSPLGPKPSTSPRLAHTASCGTKNFDMNFTTPAAPSLEGSVLGVSHIRWTFLVSAASAPMIPRLT